jgi:excisionase family DNA binding protein
MNEQALPMIRATITEAAQILRICRAKLYQRIQAGEIAVTKDGHRRYIDIDELRRYNAALSARSRKESAAA